MGANCKIFFGIILLSFLGACTTPTAMIGPVYTLSATGNVMQAGLTYGSNQMITKYTGKTPIENLKEVTSREIKNPKNIKKKTLESEDFFVLVKNRIEETNKILNKANQ